MSAKTRNLSKWLRKKSYGRGLKNMSSLCGIQFLEVYKSSNILDISHCIV